MVAGLEQSTDRTLPAIWIRPEEVPRPGSSLCRDAFGLFVHLRRPTAIRSDRRSIRRRGPGNDGARRLADSDSGWGAEAAETAFGLLVRNPLNERLWSQRICCALSSGAGNCRLVPGNRFAGPASGGHLVGRSCRGALTLAMFTGTFFFTHLVMPEPFLGCLMALSFWSLLKAAAGGRIPDRKGEVDRWLMAAWMFIALSTLAKGIHGLFIPVVARHLRRLAEAFDARRYGADFFCGHTVGFCFWRFWRPGIMATEWRYPGFLKDHFFNEQIGSALSRRSPPDSDRVPLWIFWPEHLVLLFPISLLFPGCDQGGSSGDGKIAGPG